jgi:hypothetical protein
MRVFVLLLLAALTAFGADIAGKWKATVDSAGGMRDITFIFEIKDGKVFGLGSSDQGEAPIVEGKVEGARINFVLEKDDFKAVLSGTISGDEMKLSAVVGDKTYAVPIKRVK